MVFHWRLSDSKSPQVSRTLLSILGVFNNAVVWMVSTRPPTSKPSRPFNNPLVTVPKAPITIGIIVTFMFHIFFNSLLSLVVVVVAAAAAVIDICRCWITLYIPLFNTFTFRTKHFNHFIFPFQLLYFLVWKAIYSRVLTIMIQ